VIPTNKQMLRRRIPTLFSARIKKNLGLPIIQKLTETVSPRRGGTTSVEKSEAPLLNCLKKKGIKQHVFLKRQFHEREWPNS